MVACDILLLWCQGPFASWIRNKIVPTLRRANEYFIILDNDKALNISQLSSLIKDSYFVISNDTGPAHMAAHLNVKGLVLFGSHTTAKKVSIEREHFKAIQVTDLTKLSVDKVFQRMQEAVN